MNGLLELTQAASAEIAGSDLYNKDLNPVPIARRNWGTYHIASLWIGMSVCIPTYMLASGLIAAGMNWWQAILTITLGNLIVLIPMTLNAHAGTKYGIPFPVLARASFGTLGSNVPALLRAIVACGWFGIQTWIGGASLNALIGAIFPGWLNFGPGLWICFLAFWALNVWIGYKGLDTIKFMESWGAPILLFLGACLVVWAIVALKGDLTPLWSMQSKFETSAQFWAVFLPSLTGMIGFWSTLALNIPDFTRYAKDQKSQVWGQVLGLPTTMAVFSFIGVIVTAATIIVFGQAIWDPVALLSKFSPIVVILGTFGIVVATITTNIAANVVAPAIGISNAVPRKITFGMGAVITGLVGIVIMPWKLLSSYGAYIFGWLGTYSAFLGPIAGIWIADYWLVRKQRLDIVEAFKEGGRYSYGGGFNGKAVVALIIGIVFALIGKFVPSLKILFDNAWIVGAIVSGIVYYLMMKNDPSIISEKEFADITEGMGGGPVSGGGMPAYEK
ncbi:MAG: NCS1 family nucleobase:cation symporter-1 [Peptococcaceae bacterium]|nr:NCS1 family nucleobase:cation symporter-1 [Peptococcaceae bacterium]